MGFHPYLSYMFIIHNYWGRDPLAKPVEVSQAPFSGGLHDPDMLFASYKNNLPVLPRLLSAHLCKLGWPKHSILGLIRLRSSLWPFRVSFWLYSLNFALFLHPCLCKPALAGWLFPTITNDLHPWNSPKKTILGSNVSPHNISAFEKQHILLKSHFGKNVPSLHFSTLFWYLIPKW